MPERLKLDTPKTRNVQWVGDAVPIADWDVMGFHIHRDPEFDGTGPRTGWKAQGSYVEVHVVGAYGSIEVVRIAQGGEALTLINQLNTANLSSRSLWQRLIERVRDHQVATGRDAETQAVIYSKPYAGTLTEVAP